MLELQLYKLMRPTKIVVLKVVLVHPVSTFVEIMGCATVKWLPELAVSAETRPKRKPLALDDPDPKLISLHLKMNSGICCC